jgi:hypothetical protein
VGFWFLRVLQGLTWFQGRLRADRYLLFPLGISVESLETAQPRSSRPRKTGGSEPFWAPCLEAPPGSSLKSPSVPEGTYRSLGTCRGLPEARKPLPRPPTRQKPTQAGEPQVAFGGNFRRRWPVLVCCVVGWTES